MQEPTIGFIGLGLMGKPMAFNILKHGYSVVVYNRTIEKTKELQKQGAHVANSLKELGAQSDIIITMVTAAEDVRQVLLSEEGALNTARPGTIVIDMSTIGPSATKKINDEILQRSMHFIDAPVTGSTPGAINGTLTIFIGATQEDFQSAQPVLESMGKNLQHIGPVGTGQAIKMINNHLIAAITEAVAEGMILADNMNLPRDKVAEVIKTTALASPLVNMRLDKYTSEDFALLFSMANMHKDLELASNESAVELPVLNTVKKQLEKGITQNLAEEDFSTVIKTLT